MIDWYNLIANTLWITALALALSVLSYARWEAFAHNQILWKAIKTSRWLVTLSMAGVIFCGGRAALADTFWMQVVWLVLVVAFTTLAAVLWVTRGKLP